MLSPSELTGVKFDKSAFGYRTDEVDKYVAQVGEAIADLMQENSAMEEKLEILAAKLEEYRNDEESLRAALLGAQKLGDSVIRDSKAKAEIIIRDATIRAERIMETAQKKIDREQNTLVKLQKEVGDFKNQMLVMYKQHLEAIASMPDYDDVGITAEIPSVNTPIIEDVVQKAPRPEMAQPEVPQPVEIPIEEVFAQAATPPPPPKEEPKPAKAQKASRFGELQFGEDFPLGRTVPPFMKK